MTIIIIIHLSVSSTNGGGGRGEGGGGRGKAYPGLFFGQIILTQELHSLNDSQ